MAIMADDRVIHCLFERKHEFSKHYSIPLEDNLHFNNKSKYRKRKHGIFHSPKETSYIENDHLSTVYMQRPKKSKYKCKQIKYNKLLHSRDKITFLPLILNSTGDLKVASHYSTPEVPSSKAVIAKKTGSNTTSFRSDFIVNRCCCDKNGCRDSIASSWKQPEVYRCQPSSKKVCCCNCNSDAMFEVMKSLYDCYKNKNCENCKCVLCGPRFRVETVSRAIGVGERGMEDVYSELEGKTPSQKERILKRMAREGYQLPRGRSPSEEAMIIQVKRSIGVMTPTLPAEKIRRAQAAGLMTPLRGKSPREKERILRNLAAAGIPLPLAQTPSEKRLISKVRRDMGLPPEPQTKTERMRMAKAYADGIITPLEGKTRVEKENALRRMAEAGVPLPEGRTPSERDLIEKVKKTTRRLPSELEISSEKIRRARAEGILTPLEGKRPEEKERILRGLAKNGLPLPEAKTNSERKLINKVRQELGLPREPQTESEKRNMDKAYAAGIITPLEGKTTSQKEHILRRMAEAGVPLPEGRTASEKALINKIKTELPRVPPDKLHRARTEGFLTPLEGKTAAEKERILKGLAKAGIPLPEGKTASERRLAQKVRRDLGLPPEPRTASEKIRLSRAFAEGIITPLEGKSPAEKERILRRMAAAGVPLPEGRTASERALIEKVRQSVVMEPEMPTEKIRKARAEGLLTPLQGKTDQEKEKILRGLAKAGMPLPAATTPSESRLIEKVRRDLGLPIKPKTRGEKKRLAKAYADGIITPLEGKSQAEKEKVLRRMAEAGVPLPEGRTSSERDLIEKVKRTTRRKPSELEIPSEKLRKAKAEGLLTPLEGKSHSEKERILRGLAKAGMPLPPARTQSEKNMIDNITKDLGLPPEPQTESEKRNMARAYAAGIVTPLEGKTTAQKEQALRKMAAAGISLPEGRTASERELINKVKAEIPRIPTDRLQRARAEGLLTPLEGKTTAEKERILRGLAMHGVPLPVGKTASERKMIQNIRKDLGLPPEPKTPSEKVRLSRAFAAGIITPLEGKSRSDKERILRRMAAEGVPLPEGRTSSEKALVAKIIKEGVGRPKKTPSERLRAAKTEGLLTPLHGKSPDERERILRGLAKQGLPLPEGKTASEKRIIAKVRTAMGLPPKPDTASEKMKLEKAYAEGIITPLEGKSHQEKERALRRMAEAGVTLPEGRTASERALIDKVLATTARVPSEKLRRAKAEGLLTPLEGKTQEQKEQILRGLAKAGVPLPEGRTQSEKNLIQKVRKDLGLPPPPQTSSERKRMNKAYAAGIITPLEGKTYSQKERALRKMAEAGITLPEGRTASERALINKVKATTVRIPSEKLRRAKTEGWLTPLEGKSTQEKERILRGLAKAGVPLPEGKTQSEKDLITKVKRDMALAEPRTLSEKERMAKGYAKGLVTPLEGKTTAQKERALRKMAEAGVPLPEGRTASERALIKKIRATVARIPSEKLRKAKEEGWLTPLEGKSAQEKERILRGLAKAGVPLPEGKTRSEKDLIRKVRRDMGLPPEPTRSSEQLRIAKAYAQGIITPLEGKRLSEKEKALKRMADAGIPLPEGRTSTERALIAKVKATTPRIPAEKLRKARDDGLLTPLQGKTEHEKERIIRGLAKAGVPLPEGKTLSEKKLIDRVRREMGLPPEPVSATEKVKLSKAYAAGIITPLEGKTRSEKEKILRKMVEAGIPLPEARTASERALISKVRREHARKSSLPRIASDKLRKARAAGLLTPLEGKTAKEREKILKKIAKAGLPLPKAHTPSEQIVINKVRRDLGLPPEPQTSSERLLIAKQYAKGVITPLHGKTKKQKEIALRKMAQAGVQLPEGRTPSEKALIEEIKRRPVKVREALPTDKRQRLDKATGKVIKESRGPSDECICDLLTPESEKVFRIPSGKLRAAKAEGLLTPLEGKTTEQKEKIFRKLAERGLPLPEGKTASDKRLIEKVKRDLGLPPEPETPSEKLKLEKAYAAGIIEPLEGKTRQEKERILHRMTRAGIPLPEGRTASEKALIDKVLATTHKVPSEKFRRAKAEGLLTPMEGKTRAQKEKILRGLAKAGLPFPQLKTQSENDLADKVRRDLGLPPKPRTRREKQIMAKAYADGIITPLEGKSTAEKERALRRLAEAGVSLPEGRTASERAIIAKIKAKIPRVPAERLHRAKTEGWLTPLEGKSLEEKEKILRGLAKTGMPLPEGKTPSERRLIEKVKRDMGLPPEATSPSEKVKLSRAYAAGIVTPLEGKTHSEKERILRRMAKEGIALPEGRTTSEKALINKIRKDAEREAVLQQMASEKLRAIKAEGLLSPLQGKTNEEKEKILRGLAKAGVPLPEASTPSERILIDRVRRDMGLPPEPRTSLEKRKIAKAYAAGIITPLEGKTTAQKEKVLQKMAKAGIPLPEGRTQSERALINKIRASFLEKVPSEKIRRARAEGLLTPLEGKGTEEREKILRGLAKAGIPLPEGKTASERRMIQKVRRDMGLPPEPTSSAERHRINKAYAAGIISPLEGKSHAEKERVLRGLVQAGVPLPEGRTPSERDLIDKIKKTTVLAPPSDKIRAARAAGLLTPLEGKTAAEKEEILKGLAKGGLPLPEGRTPSERRLIQKVRRDMGLPPEPTSSAERHRINKAYAAGIISPLEGKSNAEKEKILRKMAQAGVPLPEGRTASERELIDKIKKTTAVAPPSDKLRAARAAGLLTPLEGKSPEEKERILRGLAKAGVPLPEGRTPSERKMIQNVRRKLGLPPEPKSSSERIRMANAYAKGIITPLDGKSRSQKEKILRKMAEDGIPLPQGRTESEKNLIDRINAEVGPKYFRTPSEKIKRAKREGLLTPLQGKTDAQKEKILRGLAREGLPLPKGKTSSEKAMIDKVIRDMGLPPRPKTSSERRKHEKAYATGIITPLEGKTKEEKEKVLRKMAEAGIDLPEGRTASERSLINKVRKQVRGKPVSRGIGVTEEKARAGITEDIEEIEKTTKCDRACGCDRKKIRFKHSYIKIRVTSPDISSFCSCPDECIPGVRGGVFVDNEGIKVTVGRATGTPSYTPSSGSIATPLSVTSLDFSQSSESSVAATISDNYVHSITNMTDILSNAIFDHYQSNSLVKSTPTQSITTEISKYNNIANNGNIYDMIDKNISSTGFTSLYSNESTNNYQYECISDVKHSQGDTTDQRFNKSSLSSVHSQGDLYHPHSKKSTSIGIKRVSPDAKSWIDLLSPRSFITNSSSYDSIIILLTDSSSSSYIDELGTISIVSLESDSECDMIRKRISDYFQDISQESEHFKRAVDYTAETSNSHTCSIIQDYYMKGSSYKIKQTNYTKFCNSKTKRIDENTKTLPKDACGDRVIFKSLREILSQRALTDTSSICVLVSSDDAVSITRYNVPSIPISPFISIKECKSKIKSGLYVQNLPQLTENIATSTSYHRANVNVNIKGAPNLIDNRTNDKLRLQNNVSTSFAVLSRDIETNKRTHQAENRRNKDRQTRNDHYCTPKYIKSKQQINNCAQGFDINIKKELSRKEPLIKFTKNAKSEGGYYRTISKLKKLIYTNQIQTSSSVMVIEGTGTKDKPFLCRQLRMDRNEQVPDVITYMQDESSSQDTGDYQPYYNYNRELCGKMQENYFKSKKCQDQGWQVKLCEHCKPQSKVKDISQQATRNRPKHLDTSQQATRNRPKHLDTSQQATRNRPKHLDPKKSSSASAVYAVFTDTGMQSVNKDACCGCNSNNFDVIVIDLKEDKATSCNNQCQGTGYVNQINEEFLRTYERCPYRPHDNYAGGHRTNGAQTMNSALHPGACAGAAQAQLSPQGHQTTTYSNKQHTVECQCPNDHTQNTIQSPLNQNNLHQTTQTQDGYNHRICPKRLQGQSQRYDPTYPGSQLNQNTQTCPIPAHGQNILLPKKPCNCFQQNTTSTIKDVSVGPDHTVTFQPCKWKQNNQNPNQNYPVPSTPTRTDDCCFCPGPQVPPPVTMVDSSCPCPEDDLIYTYDDLYWLDKKDIMKLKSDWAQAKTGFKFTMTPKMVEADMSVEDAINYYKNMADAAALEQCKCESTQHVGTPAFQQMTNYPQPMCTQPMSSQPMSAQPMSARPMYPQPTQPKITTRTYGTKPPKRFKVTCECPPSLPNIADMKVYPASGLIPTAPFSQTPVTSDGLSVSVLGKGYASPLYNNIYCYDALEISKDKLISTSRGVTSASIVKATNSSSLYMSYSYYRI